MISSFRSKDAQRLFNDQACPRFAMIENVARRKLEMLNAAKNLNDLMVIPGNRLKALAGNRAGQHSIRINDQWRICFIWQAGDAFEVEIVGYH